MRARFISNLKTRALYFAGDYSFSIVSLLGFGVTFVQSFLFAIFLEKEDFGKIFVVATLFSIFSYLSVFGLDTALFRFYHDQRFEDKNSLNKHIFLTWVVISLCLLIFSLIFGYVLIEFFEFKLLKFNSEYIMIAVSGILFSFFLILQQYYVASKQIWHFAAISVGVKAIILGFNLASILIYGPRISHFVSSYFISTILVFLASIWYFRSILTKAIYRSHVKEIFRFVWPLALNSVISISFTNGYRILISSIISFSQLAIYGIISQIAAAYYIGVTSLVLPHISAAYQHLQSSDGTSTKVPSYLKKCIYLGVLGFIAIIFISTFILKHLRNGEYFEGFYLLPILLTGQFFFIIYSHEYIIHSYFGKTSRITLSTLSGITIILTTFYFIISQWGLVGACFVVLMGYLAQYVTALYFRKGIKTKLSKS